MSQAELSTRIISTGEEGAILLEDESYLVTEANTLDVVSHYKTEFVQNIRFINSQFSVVSVFDFEIYR